MINTDQIRLVLFDVDGVLTDWPVESYNRHVGIYAYRVSVLIKLASTSQCDIEKLEKLEQLRAVWLGYRISMMAWPKVLQGGIDTVDDVERVRKILNKKGGK